MREAAAQALATYGGREAIEALRWTASADQDEAVVSAALAGLAALVSGHADTVADAVQALAAVAADPARRPAVFRSWQRFHRRRSRHWAAHCAVPPPQFASSRSRRWVVSRDLPHRRC